VKLPTILAFAAVALLVLALVAPFALVQEFRRRADEPLPPWMGTPVGRRQRLVMVAALLFSAVVGLATVANLTAK
jgi:hypothetical protein